MVNAFSGEKKVATNSSQQSEAWAPTIPTLRDLISKIGTQANTSVGPSADQTMAIDTLKKQAQAGNPWLTDIGKLTTDMFGNTSRSGMATDAYETLKSQLGSYADGSKVNANDPTLNAAIEMASNDVQDRINRQWAGAGRDLSGGNGMAVAKGVASVAIPARLDYITKQQGNQLAAAQALQTAGMGTAAAAQQLDQSALDQRTKGIDTAKEYLAAQGWGPEQVANLEQQLKELPAQDLSRVLQMIMPIAQSGGQATGESTQRTTQTPSVASVVGGGLSLAGKLGLLGPVGQLASVADIVKNINGGK